MEDVKNSKLSKDYMCTYKCFAYSQFNRNRITFLDTTQHVETTLIRIYTRYWLELDQVLSFKTRELWSHKGIGFNVCNLTLE